MSRFRYLIPSMMAASVALSMVSPVHAETPDETGIVRVTDSPEIAQEMQATVENCPNCPQGGHVVSGCPNCPGYGPNCGHCRLGRKVHQILDWFNPYGMCTFSPDHGWAPPTKQRIYRQSIAYQKQFPDQWMGYPAGQADGGYRAPSVYMPTDTTQLGYYYQHAPRWWPYQGMIPPTPHPADWHVMSAYNQGCKTCQHGYGGEVVGTYSSDGGQVIVDAEPTPATDVVESKPAAPEVPPAPSSLERADATPQLKQIR